MATVTVYSLMAEEEVAPVVLTASDDAAINLSRKSVMIIENTTGVDVDINVIGDTATSVECDGVGTIDLSGGKTFTITANAVEKIPLNPTYQEWLKSGALTITNGAGCEAYILQLD